jgi:hypothetical protein
LQLLKESKTHIVITPTPINVTEEETPTTHTDVPTENEVFKEIRTELDLDDKTLNVREKKIKGIAYYLSDDNNVYEKTLDESIGKLLGKIDGKKVRWL